MLLCLPDEYVGKGDRLYVTGRLVHDSYEGEDGQRRYYTEVHTKEVVFLDSRPSEDRTGNGQRDTEVESSRGL